MKRVSLALAILLGSGHALAQAAPPSGGVPPAVAATQAPVVVLQAPPQSSSELRLDEVIASVDARYPLLLAEAQGLAAARGERRSAIGAFDPSWKTKASAFPVGFYRYVAAESVVEQPLYWRGLSVFGGYRIGQGKFPIYYDNYRTNNRGELRVGFTAPILRGSSIDKERASLWKTDAGIDAAAQNLAAARLEFRRNAADKYWEWVSAGAKLFNARALYERAVERNAGIGVRVTSGDAPAIEQVDNTRAMLQREQQVVGAERALISTRLALSLYLRDDKGNPVIPSEQRVPRQFPEPIALAAGTVELDVARAVSQRPELRLYEAKRRQYEIERDLAQNDKLPTVDVLVAGAKQFGDGYPEKDPATLEAGLLIDIPLRNRRADGRARTAEAMFMQYDLQLRYAKDKIQNEVRDAAAGSDAAARRLVLARQELLLARTLEVAERQRFDMGDSTMLVVNLREQASYDAAIREVETLVEHHKSLALYRAVVGAP